MTEGLSHPAHGRAGGCGAAHRAGTDAAGTAGLSGRLPSRWISAFLDAQAAERDAARNTRLAYGRDLMDFAGWLAQRGRRLCRGATREDVEDYLVGCEAQGLSKATRARRLSAIRQLYRFAHEEGWRADNPALPHHGARAGRSACRRP